VSRDVIHKCLDLPTRRHALRSLNYVCSQSGPKHEPSFTVAVRVGDEVWPA